MNPLDRREFIAGAAALCAWPAFADGDSSLTIKTPMRPPEWALLQRELLRVQTEACEAFFARYFDDRGYLRAVERWTPGWPIGTRIAFSLRQTGMWTITLNSWPRPCQSFRGSTMSRMIATKPRKKRVPITAAATGMSFRMLASRPVTFS